MVCESCGKEINLDPTEETENDGRECPECGRCLCNDCAAWKVVVDESICMLCASQYIRGFHWSNKAWYAEANGIKNGEINFGIYNLDGGCVGEMTMKWINLGSELVPKLGAFEDSWKVLATFKDVIDALGLVNGKKITEYEFVKILLGCGFTDLTAYIRGKK